MPDGIVLNVHTMAAGQMESGLLPQGIAALSQDGVNDVVTQATRKTQLRCRPGFILSMVVVFLVAIFTVCIQARRANASPLDAQGSILDELRANTPAGPDGWKFDDYDRFRGATHEEIVQLMGLGGESGALMLATQKHLPARTGSLPVEFDARSRWPECQATMWHIRDQSQCGGCWAFGTTTAFNDRVCIASKGKMTSLLSPTDVLSCCNPDNGCSASHGCDGGWAAQAWVYFRDHGLVTGGDHDAVGRNDTCWAYPLTSYAKHTGKHNETTPSCRADCDNKGYPLSFAEDKHYAKSAYRFETIDEIKQDIMENGPVTCAMDVYSDLMVYKSGVYRHKVGKMLGAHVLRVLGWGVDPETGGEYWHVANSWNAKWGEHGFIRVGFGEGIAAPPTDAKNGTNCVAGIV